MRNAALFLSLFAITACAEGPTGHDAANDAALDPIAEAPDVGDTAEPLRVVDHDGATFSFYVSDDHDVALVAELSDADAPSLVARLSEQSATPLEVFQLVSDDAPPLALVEHHHHVALELGLDDVPRGEDELLPIGPPADPLVIESIDTSASCSQSVDKPQWQSEKAGISADWWRYWSATSSNQKSFIPSDAKAVFVTHLCNKARTGDVAHMVLSSAPASSGSQLVPIGQRSLMYGLGSTEWEAWQVTWPGSGRYQFGASARK